MARRKSSKSVKNICTVCGEVFYSAQKADFCTHKSTCRVKYHQQKKMASKIAATFTMNMDAYQLYQVVIDKVPAMKSYLDAFLFKHGVAASEDMLMITFGAIKEIELVEPQ